MENIKDFFKNRKILIVNKKDLLKFQEFNVFKEGETEPRETEETYKNIYYHNINKTSKETMLIEEENYNINLYHVWKFEEFLFLSKEEYCEDFDEFIRFQVMSNDYGLIPESLLNYAKRYEKLENRQAKMEKDKLIEMNEIEKNQEEIQKLLDNSLKRAYKEYYVGEMVVIMLKK